jgi:hypothetical protein
VYQGPDRAHPKKKPATASDQHDPASHQLAVIPRP